MNGNNIIHFDNFGVEYILKEIKKFIGNKNIITNIYRIQAYNSIMCGYFSIGFINFMLKGKSLLNYTNLFSPNKYEKYENNNTKLFSIINKVKMKNLSSIICAKLENLKILKYHTYLKKTLVLFIICSKCRKKDEIVFKEQESIEILKILGLRKNT